MIVKSYAPWLALQRPYGLAHRASLATQSRRGNAKATPFIPRARKLGKSPSPAAAPPPSPPPTPPDTVSKALHDADPKINNLLAPVHCPEDPNGVLRSNHPATKILENSAIVVQRELEMMNIMLGFEQANKYVIMDPQGNHLGYMAEQEFGMGNMMARQWFRTHRSFTTHVFDRSMKEVLRFHRPFSLVSSRIRIYDPLEVATMPLSSSTAIEKTPPGTLSTNVSDLPTQISHLSLSDMRIIGEAQQQWAPLRRKYNLFLYRPFDSHDTSSTSHILPPDLRSESSAQQLQLTPVTSQSPEGGYDQFAYVDEPFLSWDFSLLSSDNKLIGSVNRNFAGIGREIFTDTGVYALRMDAAGLSEEPGHLISKTGQTNPSAYADSSEGRAMSLDHRAVMLATAVSVDFDYFSRSRSGMGGFMPLWFGGGGEAAGAGAAGEAAGGVAAGEAGAGAVGGVVRGAAGGVGEGATGAAAGMGTMAGYEAMQRGAYGRGDDASPTGDYQPPPSQPPSGQAPNEEVWGNDSNPWRKDSGGSGGDGGGDGGGGDGGGGGGGDGGGFDIGDWF